MRLAGDVPPDEAAELQRRYDAGETLLGLLAGFDGTYRTLRTVLQAQGVVFRAAQPIMVPAPPGMVEIYLSGQSLIETGKRFGFGRDVTTRMLRDAGVKIRERGRPPK